MSTEQGKALKEAVAYYLGASGGVYCDVIQQRFGIGTARAETLEHLATEVGCTRERIRQIESRFIDQISRHVSRGESRFPSWDPLIKALAASDGTWTDATQRAEALYGTSIYLPGLTRLANASGVRLPVVGFDALVRARGYSVPEVRALLERTLAKRLQPSTVAAWCLAPYKGGHQDAPVWAIQALLAAERTPEVDFSPDLKALSQPELIRALMRRSGFTRAKMMSYLEVNRSTFDRWLWPADNPVTMPLASRSKLVQLSKQVGTEDKPRKRHLGPPKEYATKGIPGCARQSRSRLTDTLVTLYKTAQAKNLPKECEGPWTTVCEDHRVAANWPSFSEGLAAMATSMDWCPDCGSASKQKR